MCRVATKSLVQISKASCAIRARADGKLRYFSVPSGQYICHLIRSSSQMSSSTESHLSMTLTPIGRQAGLDPLVQFASCLAQTDPGRDPFISKGLDPRQGFLEPFQELVVGHNALVEKLTMT